MIWFAWDHNSDIYPGSACNLQRIQNGRIRYEIRCLYINMISCTVDQMKIIVTKVNEDRRARMVEDFGIDSIVSVKTATADAIMSYVRARKNSQGSANVETMYQLVDDKVEALEFIVKAETNYTGIPLKNLSLKPNNLIACIARKRQIILPSGDDCIQVGDNVIIITMEKQIEDIKDILM